MKQIICIFLVSGFSLSACNNVSKNQTKFISSETNTTKKENIQSVSNTPIDTSDKSFEGNWEWEKYYNDTNPADPRFNIIIKIKDRILYGYYCSVTTFGDKIDVTGDDDSDYSFKVTDYSRNSFTTKFQDNFSPTEGTVKISLVSGKLIWQIITPPNGEYHIPDTAILIRKVRN